MTSAPSADDDRLLRALRTALHPTADAPQREPVPDRVVDDARAALAWRTIDDDLALATLDHDSLLQDSVGGRGPALTPQPRLLSFDAGGLSVEFEVADGVLTGQLVPAGGGRVTLGTAAGVEVSTAVDEAGGFSLARPGDGPLRLTCRAGGSTLRTPWLLL